MAGKGKWVIVRAAAQAIIEAGEAVVDFFRGAFGGGDPGPPDPNNVDAGPDNPPPGGPPGDDDTAPPPA